MFDELLSKGGLSLDRLRSFCQVAERGGVTKAAKGDPTRQSLFSRQIKELEEFFGVELVRRKGRGVALTTAGEQLHALAREHLLALADFKQACAGHAVQLTVAAGDSLIRWLLLPRLKSIRARMPGAAFRILNLATAESATRLREGTVDLALVRAESTKPPLKTCAVGAMTFSLFVPRRMRPAARAEEFSTEAFGSLPLATLEGSGQFRQKLDQIARRRKAGLRIELELSSFPLVARAVQSGDFAAILPSIASAELADAEVIELKPDFLRALSREIVLAWNPRQARIRAALGKALPVWAECCRLPL